MRPLKYWIPELAVQYLAVDDISDRQLLHQYSVSISKNDS